MRLLLDESLPSCLRRSLPGHSIKAVIESMKESARYAKIVEWSEEDQCFVGSSPGLIYSGCHGQDEKAVFDELCQVVEEAISLYHQDGKALPPPTSGRD